MRSLWGKSPALASALIVAFFTCALTAAYSKIASQLVVQAQQRTPRTDDAPARAEEIERPQRSATSDDQEIVTGTLGPQLGSGAAEYPLLSHAASYQPGN